MHLIDLIGFLLPPVIDLINRKIADSDLRFWVSVGVCAILGFGLSLAGNGTFILDDVVSQIFVIFGLAQISYKGIYSDTKLQNIIRG